MLKKYCQSLIINWKENLYLLSITAFLVSLPTSIALISCTSVALLIVWVLTGDYRTKWNRLIHNKGALLLMSIPVIYLIGLCFTHNFSLGIQEFNKSFYWFIFAFVLGSSSPISSKKTYGLLSIYILVVAIAASVALLKFFFIDSIHFFDFRKITWIDHIPFSYQVAFVIWLLIYFTYQGKPSLFQRLLSTLLILFLIVSLFSLKAFTAYLYFGVMTITALILFVMKTKKRIQRYCAAGLLLFIIIFPIYYVHYCVRKFYNTTEYKENEIENYTALGNKYVHHFEDKTIENGNYVRLFLCREELEPLWNARSQRKYDCKTADGYPLFSVIIRYMASKGLRKDAEGFAQLSQKDIENIEKEIPNHIYAKNKLSVYPRIYALIWEMDQYKIKKNSKDKTLAQRIDLVSFAIEIVNKHFWVGIGLGNSINAYDEVIAESGSNLVLQNTKSSHNQYLNYVIRFGILGTLYIVGVLIWVFITGRKNNPFLITIFFVSMLAANLGDANWETFIGLNFFAFFWCFLMWITPKEFLINRK